jgi:acetyltransferase EpsM
MDAVKAVKKVAIWGASGHARVVADILMLAGWYEVVGFIDDVNPAPRKFLALPVWGGREALDALKAAGVTDIIVGFGNCEGRLNVAEFILAQGFSLATAVHPRAIVADDVVIGAGSVVAAGAVINPGSRIGKNVIVNTSACVDHDCVVADGAHVCPGVTLGGNVIVGRAAWVGIGATVRDHIRIGAGTLIGAGAVVVEDMPDGVVAYGVPAKVKSRS